MVKRSYTPRTTDDGATEHIVTSKAAPTKSEKHEIAQKLQQDEHLFESRDGACRIKRLPGLFSRYCTAFGECDACSVSRLQAVEPRQRFHNTVVERELDRVASAPGSVRTVSIGCGGLLTDFKILLALWSRGCTIESFVAIDTGYTDHAFGHGRSRRDYESYMESLAALARFFAPTCRVFSFTSCDDYIAAATRRPERYAMATMFLHCDAGPVAEVQYKDVAATALLPGGYSYELWNVGGLGVPARPPLETQLPERLRTELLAIYSGKRYSLGVRRRRASEEVAGTSVETERAVADDKTRVLVGLGETLIEEVSDPSLASSEEIQGKHLMVEAVRWLEITARQRAAKHGKRLFKVVYDAGPQMPMRDGPSLNAKLAGARAAGDEVIVDEVRPDGWARVSRLLDTREGYELYHHERIAEKWMPIRSADGGELMREVVLDVEECAVCEDVSLF